MSVDILGTDWDQCRSMVQCSFTSTETRRLIRTDSPGWPPQLSHSSWTMKVWEKWDKLFKTLTVCEKRVGSVKVCEFCGLQSAREKLSVYWSETFLRPNSSLNKNNCRTESEGTHFLSVLTDRVHWPLATVRVAPLNRCAEELRTFMLLFHAILQRFVKSLWILKGFFCVNPVLIIQTVIQRQ